MRIDSHQHFWNYDPVKDAWITGEMEVIRRDFLPGHLAPILKNNRINGSVAVQAGQSEAETFFLLDLADKNDFIKGVVGWVDLRSPELAGRLMFFSSFEKLKGFRHIVQAEPEDFLLRRDFANGIGMLKEFGFTYDILVFPKHLPNLIKFVRQLPGQPFVLDHLAKPYIKKGEIKGWKKDLANLAVSPNVYCKLSGMATEADWAHWKKPDFKPYIDIALDCFGVERVMFGSDWPVCLLAASYDQCCEILEENTKHLSATEKNLLWGGNAELFYKL